MGQVNVNDHIIEHASNPCLFSPLPDGGGVCGSYYCDLLADYTGLCVLMVTFYQINVCVKLVTIYQIDVCRCVTLYQIF